MSNFNCPYCGLTNIDCGEAGYKTHKEIELEKQNIKLIECIKKIRDIELQSLDIDWDEY